MHSGRPRLTLEGAACSPLRARLWTFFKKSSETSRKVRPRRDVGSSLHVYVAQLTYCPRTFFPLKVMLHLIGERPHFVIVDRSLFATRYAARLRDICPRQAPAAGLLFRSMCQNALYLWLHNARTCGPFRWLS